MPARVIAIGDIHGCATALRAVLKQVELRADDTLITLGDCVDRGPDSRGVIEELLALREHCHLVPLLGNHEEMMLSYLEGRPLPDNWLEFGGVATLKSYTQRDGSCEIPDAHLDFIRSWGDWYECDSHFFVHGSYDPDLPLPEQRWNAYRWHSLKSGLPEPHVSGQIAVVGHTSQKSGEILDAGHLVCIDTYCWGGGWLTAYEPASGQVWQVDQNGLPRKTTT